MFLTLQKAKEMMYQNNGDLVLSGTDYTEISEGLVVAGSLRLENSKIKQIPNGLVIGRCLYLKGSEVQELPNNLKLGQKVYCNFKFDKRINKTLKIGTYDAEKSYIYTGDEIVFVSEMKTIDGLTYYVGENKEINVLTDGNRYIKCRSYEDGLKWFVHDSSQKFEKYFLVTSNLKFDSFVSFENLKFKNGKELLQYCFEKECVDENDEFPKIFDDLEDAQKSLDEMVVRVNETATNVGFSIECEIPYIECVACESNIKEYDLNCDYDIIKIVAVADL